MMIKPFNEYSATSSVYFKEYLQTWELYTWLLLFLLLENTFFNHLPFYCLSLDLLMPSEQYALQLQNHVPAPVGNKFDPVAKLDQRTSKVTALQEGQTNIVLLHKNILYKIITAYA